MREEEEEEEEEEEFIFRIRVYSESYKRGARFLRGAGAGGREVLFKQTRSQSLRCPRWQIAALISEIQEEIQAGYPHPSG